MVQLLKFSWDLFDVGMPRRVFTSTPLTWSKYALCNFSVIGSQTRTYGLSSREFIGTTSLLLCLKRDSSASKTSSTLSFLISKGISSSEAKSRIVLLVMPSKRNQGPVSKAYLL